MDLAATASLIDSLDVIVSVDTMVAHLAGALGKKVYLLLHTKSDWRWLREREDSPWYPTMRLLRQSTAGDWAPPVSRLVDYLK
jgi:ADP-heptose:LPS heptosyltransferase